MVRFPPQNRTIRFAPPPHLRSPNLANGDSSAMKWGKKHSPLRKFLAIPHIRISRRGHCFLDRLMSESRLGNHDLNSNAAPDCFQPQKTGCRPHCLRLPLWTTPSHSQDFLQIQSSCLRFFYLVCPFWHFSLETSFILLTIDLISLSWFSPLVCSSMFLPSSFTTLLVFQKLCGVWISLQPLPASTSTTTAATANAAHHYAPQLLRLLRLLRLLTVHRLHGDKGKERVQKIPKSDNLPSSSERAAGGPGLRKTTHLKDRGRSRKI